MAASSSKRKKKSKEKKKGPKGKQARAKAKLDRHWGERINDNDDDNDNKTKSKVRSRLVRQGRTVTATATTTATTYRTKKEDDRRFDNKSNDSDDDESSSVECATKMEDDGDDNDDNAGLLLDFLKKKRGPNSLQRGSDDEHASDSGDGDYDDDKNDNDGSGDESSSSSILDDGPLPDPQPLSLADIYTNRFECRDPLPESSSLLAHHPNTVRPVKTTLGRYELWQSPRPPLASSDAEKTVSSIVPLDHAKQRCRALYQKSNATEKTATGTTSKDKPPPLLDPSPSSWWTQTAVSASVSYAMSHYVDVLHAVSSDKTRQPRRRPRRRVAAAAKGDTADNYHHNHHDIDSTTMAAIWHLLHHVWTSRNRIYHHTKQVRAMESASVSMSSSSLSTNGSPVNTMAQEEHTSSRDRVRDQGYTRPTVLVLLPTRSCCYDFVQGMLSILNVPPLPSTLSNTDNDDDDDRDVTGADRFEAEFGAPPMDKDDGNDAETAADRHRRTVLRDKGAAWNQLFGDHRNSDDDFKIGVQLQPKAATAGKGSNNSQNNNGSSKCGIKLYSDFYRADIILASPLGLKMAADSKRRDDDDDYDGNSNDDESMEDDNNRSRGSKKEAGSADFLSSIEICLVTRANVLLQQNWDHVNAVLDLLNLPPKAMNHTDFSRVRQYTLAGQSAHWRQLIILSSLLDPCILSTFKRYSKSISGSVQVRQKIPTELASISSVLLPTRQVFRRVSCTSFSNQSEARLTYFVEHVLPQLEKQKQHHTMIFIPSYFDFCSLRNILLKRRDDLTNNNRGGGLDFVSVTEYARATEVSRGRARFLQGRKPLLLYTGRAHFFLRHAIKGVRHLVWLGVPEEASFYTEHVNRLNRPGSSSLSEEDSSPASCLALFTKYDSHALERIAGTDNCRRMVQADTSTFVFSSS